MTVIEIIGIDIPVLGDRSYLATDGRVALVVDPQRDIDRVLAAAAGHGAVCAVPSRSGRPVEPYSSDPPVNTAAARPVPASASA
jgi:hypothetical protein